MLNLGAHISVAGNRLSQVLKLVQQTGLTTAQIFVGSPQRYVVRQYDEQEAEAVRAITKTFPLILHVAYVANPAIQGEDLRKKVATYYIQCDEQAARLGAIGFVSHSGSYGEGGTRADGIARVHQMLEQIHLHLKTKILLENVAGFGTSLGRSPEDMVEMVQPFPKAGIVWDVAHAYGQGCDMSDSQEVGRCLRVLGDRLACIHLNGVPAHLKLGSHMDRHELMLSSPHLATPELMRLWFTTGVPLIVEAAEGRNAVDDVVFLGRIAQQLSLDRGTGIK